MAKYRLLAVRASDLRVDGEIPFSNLTFSDVLNEAGSISVTIPLLDDSIVPARFVTPGRTALFVERDGTLVWGGMIWATSVDLVAQTIQVGGEGFFSYYDRRVNGINFDTGAFLPGFSGGDITYTMWQFLRTSVEDMTVGGTVVDPDWATGYTGPTGVPAIDATPWFVKMAEGGFGWNVITKIPATDYVSHGDIIRDMCAGKFTSTLNSDGESNNCDFAVVPSWDTVNNKPKLTWAFWNKARGKLIDRPLTLDGSIVSLNVSYDSSSQANKIHVLGGGDEVAAHASTTRGRQSNAVFMERAFTTDLVSDGLCLAYAKRMYKAYSGVNVIPQIGLRGDNPAWLWPSYDVGDTFLLDVDAGFVNLSRTWRIVEKATSLDESGTETVSLTVADSARYE